MLFEREIVVSGHPDPGTVLSYQAHQGEQVNFGEFLALEGGALGPQVGQLLPRGHAEKLRHNVAHVPRLDALRTEKWSQRSSV